MTTLLFFKKKNMCSCDTHIQLITYSEQRTFAFAKNIIAYILQNVNKIKIKFINFDLQPIDKLKNIS